MTKKKIFSAHTLSLMQFKNHPSEYTALSAFVNARKCNEEIPEDVLEYLTPMIEQLHKERQQNLLDQLPKAIKQLDEKKLLLKLAVEEDSIELACARYKKLVSDSPVIGSIRKALERLLCDTLNTYMKNNIADPNNASKYFPFKGTDTANMLKIYREIIAMENA